MKRCSLVAKEARKPHGFASWSSNADEVHCNMTRQVACGERCIPVAWLCNGERECPDGTDEQCGKHSSFLHHVLVHVWPLLLCAQPVLSVLMVFTLLGGIQKYLVFHAAAVFQWVLF